MTTVREGGTPLYTGSTSWVTGVVSEDVHSALNVDEVVHIDADHADGVIRVRHIAANGVDILEATDKGRHTHHANRRQYIPGGRGRWNHQGRRV